MSGEKKIFWVRNVFLFFSLCISFYVMLSSYVHELGLCYLESGVMNCVINYNATTGPLLSASLFLSVVLICSFFISAKTFKKWLIYATTWLAADVIWIIDSPIQSHRLFDFGPTTKESVSVWMGFFLVFSSIAMFLVSKMEDVSTWKKWAYGVLIFIIEVFLFWMLT